MAYFAPYIDTTGIHLPTYRDIQEDLINEMKSIYGDDIYIEEDTQDYQMISAFSSKMSDCLDFLEMVYGSYNVKTAVGTTLDNIVKLNGIERKSASYSTVELSITGTIGTIIRNGIVSDGTHRWILDNTELVITSSPITASATCEDIGAIEALPHSVNQIVNITKGWLSVDNPLRASVGEPIETDANLRIRQGLSVAQPSVNMVESLYAGIIALENVSTCKIYDNDTHITDINGIPPHSVSCVVEGGNSQDIAKVIYLRKGPGTGTYGTTSETITISTGLPNTINFFRPSDLSVDVQISITRSALYTSDTENKIKTAISDYFKNITIGTDILRSSIIAVVSQVVTNIYEPEFKINLPVLTAVTGDPLLDADTDVPFNQKAVLGTFTIVGGIA